MTLKRTELAKLAGLKIDNQLRQSVAASRFGKAAAEVVTKREQRERERALGLVPFAVKLNQTLVNTLHAEAKTRGQPLNELVAELLQKGLQ